MGPNCCARLLGANGIQSRRTMMWNSQPRTVSTTEQLAPKDIHLCMWLSHTWAYNGTCYHLYLSSWSQSCTLKMHCPTRMHMLPSPQRPCIMSLTLCEYSEEQALNPWNTVTNKRVGEIDGNTSRMWRLAKPASKRPFKPTRDQSGEEHQSTRSREGKKWAEYWLNHAPVQSSPWKKEWRVHYELQALIEKLKADTVR